jgi:predicted Zn-dependent protease
MIAGRRPISQRLTAPAVRLVACLVAGALAVGDTPVRAQGRGGPPVLRDAEIEQLLRDYTQPILRAAGLLKQNISVVIINDRAFNAFVMDGRRIFVNAGALMDSQTPNQIIGVLAHETGHIAGGHLSKMREEMSNLQTMAVVAMLLGMGAMAAGAATGARGVGDVGMAAITAPQSVMLHSMLSYIRAQEEQADRAGVKFLTTTGQSAKGMYDTFKRMYDQTVFQSQRIDPYLQSHPMPAERIAALTEIAKTNPYWEKQDPPELQLRHDMMRAKMFGFLDQPETLYRRYPMSDTSLPARYARAIAYYRHRDIRSALPQIDALIQAQPGNPYFQELKGQALLESGHPAEAVAPLRYAVAHAPNPTLIQVMLGQALIATNDAKLADEAVTHLRTAIGRDPDIPDAYAQLAMAYGRKGDYAQADLASAQAAFSRGDYPTARQLATRAKGRFAIGTPGWVKADDIASYKPPKANRRN